MKPIVIKDPSLKNLIDACQDYIDLIETGFSCDDILDDYKQFIFEEAMEAIFGKKVFDWINMRT